MNIISSDNAKFHYTRRAVTIEKILFENQFQFSYFKNSNDPYEYRNKMIGSVGWGARGDSSELIALDKILIEHTLFISTCSNEFKQQTLLNHGFLKSRMWSQYGENHEGICLIFNKKKLIRLLEEKFESQDFTIWEGDVEYKEYLYDYSNDHTLMDLDNYSVDTSPEKIAFMHVEKYNKALFFRKQFDYKDEHEYRVVILCKNSARELGFEVKNCLDGIILGDRFPKAYNPTIINLCKNMNIPCKKLHWESGEFFLLETK